MVVFQMGEVLGDFLIPFELMEFQVASGNLSTETAYALQVQAGLVGPES